VAHWLRDRGFEAYAVRGGVAALEGDPAAPVAVAAPAATPATGGSLAALRFPTFRRYAAGVLLSLTGNWIEAAAFGYVVLLLGGSAVTLGLIGFLNTIPNLVWGLPAGVLADRYDRRRLLLGYQGANMAVAIALAALWQTGALTVGLMGALAVVGGSLGTLSYPAFQGLLASTVPAAELESAVAINSLSLQVARFLGPAIAGVLLAQGGPTWVFTANAASFVAVLAAVALLPAGAGAVRRAAAATAQAAGGLREALHYVFAQRSLASLIALTALGGVFATPPVAFMIPALARIQLGGGPATLAVLTAAIGLGSVVGAVLLLRLARRANKGEPLVAGFVVTGLAIVGVGLSHSVPLSAALAAIGGCGGVVFVGLSTVVVQASASDEMRARVSAIWAAAFVGLLPFGALLTGALAAWLGAGRAVAVDGAIAVAGALLIVARRPEVTWVGCAALPAACLAATDPGAAIRMTALTGGDDAARSAASTG
jgi:MFS family permease